MPSQHQLGNIGINRLHILIIFEFVDEYLDLLHLLFALFDRCVSDTLQFGFGDLYIALFECMGQITK